MKKKIVFVSIWITVLTCLISCNNRNYPDLKNIEKIEVNVKKKYEKGDFKSFFSSSIVVALETNAHSIFHNIDRMILFDNKIFILDKKSNCLLIFDKHGRFLGKIENIGRGPREYQSLMDFSIDENKKRIVLYADRPYKLLYYELNGQFLKEVNMDELYFSMTFDSDNILFLSKDIENNKMFSEYNLLNQKQMNFLTMNDKDIFFKSLGTQNPNIVKSKKNLISLPYSEVIYEYGKNEISPKYYIDFGENKTPDNIVSKLEKDYKGIFKYMKENNYGFGISNFRENKNYIVFNFWGNMITIYSKRLKKTKTFRVIMNSDDQIPFYNYFAHDGDDDKLISIYPSDQFKSQMNLFKENDESWKKVPDYIKKMDTTVSKNDNPLLLIYTFKD